MLLQDIPWRELDPKYYTALRRRYRTSRFTIWQLHDGTFDICSDGQEWNGLTHLTAQAVLFHLTLPQEVIK